VEYSDVWQMNIETCIDFYYTISWNDISWKLGIELLNSEKGRGCESETSSKINGHYHPINYVVFLFS